MFWLSLVTVFIGSYLFFQLTYLHFACVLIPRFRKSLLQYTFAVFEIRIFNLPLTIKPLTKESRRMSANYEFMGLIMAPGLFQQWVDKDSTVSCQIVNSSGMYTCRWVMELLMNNVLLLEGWVCQLVALICKFPFVLSIKLNVTSFADDYLIL